MDYRQGISSYQDIQFQTADPGKLIIQLYQKLSQELHNTYQYIQKQNTVQKGEAIQKSQDIIMELHNSLNFEAGEIAKNLQSLYLFLFRELNTININRNIIKLKKVIQVVDNLKSAWEEVIQTTPKNKSKQSNIGKKVENLTVVK